MRLEKNGDKWTVTDNNGNAIADLFVRPTESNISMLTYVDGGTTSWPVTELDKAARDYRERVNARCARKGIPALY